MKRSSLLLSCLGILLGLSACAGAPGADDGSTQDASPETAAQDALVESAAPGEGGARDAASEVGLTLDTGPEASAPEAGNLDAGPDASAQDVGFEASAPEAGRDASAPDVSVNDSGASADDGTPTCPGTMHVCLCATGYYCLRIGASCLAPTAPCP